MIRYSKNCNSGPDIITIETSAPNCIIKKLRNRKIIAANDDIPKIAKGKCSEVASTAISETACCRELNDAMKKKIAKKRTKNRTGRIGGMKKRKDKSRVATVQLNNEDSPNLISNKKSSVHSDSDKVSKFSNKKIKQMFPSNIVLRSKTRNESRVVTSQYCDEDSTLTNKMDVADPIVINKEIYGNNVLEDISRIVKIDTRSKSSGIGKKKISNLRVVTLQPSNDVYASNMTSKPDKPISLHSLSTARKQKLREINDKDGTSNMADSVTKKSRWTHARNKNKVERRVVESQLGKEDSSETTIKQDVEKVPLASSTISENVINHKLNKDQSENIPEVAKEMANKKFYITNRPLSSEQFSNDTLFEGNQLEEELEVSRTSARKVYPSSKGIRTKQRIVTSLKKGTNNDQKTQVGTKVNHGEQTKFLNLMNERNCEITCSDTSKSKIVEPNIIHSLTLPNEPLADYVDSDINESDKLSSTRDRLSDSSYATNDIVTFDGKVPRILMSDILQSFDFNYKVKKSNEQYVEDMIYESQPNHDQYYEDIHTNRINDTCKDPADINQDEYHNISSSSSWSDSFSSSRCTFDEVCTHSSNFHTKSNTSLSPLLNSKENHINLFNNTNDQRFEDKNNIDCDINLLINSQDVEFMSWISNKYNSHHPKNTTAFMQTGETLIEEAKVIEKCKSTKEKFKWPEENGLKDTHQNILSKEGTDVCNNAHAITKTNVYMNHTESVNDLFSENTQSVSDNQAIKNTVEFAITRKPIANAVYCPDKTYDGDDDCISLYADSICMLSENIHIEDTRKPQNLIKQVVHREAEDNDNREEANLRAKDDKVCPIVFSDKCDDWIQQIHPESHKNTIDNKLSLSQFRAVPFVKSEIFSRVCVFNIISRCNKQDRCRFIHRILLKDEVANTIMKINNIDFIKEYLLVRNYPTLTFKYMHCFVKACKDRGLSRLLQEMAVDLYPLINPDTNEKSFWKVRLLESILLDIGNDKITFCQDLLSNNLGNDYLVCDMFMDTIAGSQNFTQFQVVFELTRFYCNIKRPIKIKVATRILERTCMLQCQDYNIIDIVCEIILHTDLMIFQNSFIDRFESKLSINRSLLNKFRAAKEKASQLRWINNNMLRKEVSDASTQVNMPQLQYRDSLSEWKYNNMNRDLFKVRHTDNNCDYPIFNRTNNNSHESGRFNWTHPNINAHQTNYAYKPSCDDFMHPQNSPYSSYSPRFVPKQLRQTNYSRRFSPILS